MTRDLTATELVLLGLLAERPRHGYELEEVIVERGMREWTEIGFSSIYYVLGKLLDRGLLKETAAQPARGRPRKVYAPTSAGYRALAQAAEAVVAKYKPVYPVLLLGLANQPAVAPERFVAALAVRIDAVGERIRALSQAAETQPDVPDFVRAIFDFSLGQLAAELAWLTSYRAHLSKPATMGGKTVTVYDVKKELKELYAPKNSAWALVEVHAMQFVGTDGAGNPNTSSAYSEAIEALYSVAYAIKLASKRQLGQDFVVAPLEGLWWAEKPSVFTKGYKDSWHWTMLIHQPGWVTEEMIENARQAVLAKKKLPAIERIRRVDLREGTCAQVLHIGSYDDEAPVLASLHGEYLAAHGLDLNGLHHEIYLSDPRRTDPAKLKTILRQPVRPSG